MTLQTAATRLVVNLSKTKEMIIHFKKNFSLDSIIFNYSCLFTIYGSIDKERKKTYIYEQINKIHRKISNEK